MAADMARSLRLRQLVWELAGNDIFAGVHLTMLGPIWLIVQPLLWMLTIVLLVQPSLPDKQFNYPLYVAVGIIFYSGIQTFMTGGTQVFVKEKSRILNVALPLSVFAMKNMARVLIELVVTSPIIIVTMIFSRPDFGPAMLLALPGILIYFVFGFGVTLALGTIASRFADVIYLTMAAMRVMLFMTPVFWLPEQTRGARHVFANFNPLYHILTVVREPLMGVTPAPLHYVVASLTALGALAAGLTLFARFRGRIPLWI
jgi:ABC-type polysaccharide/polyol phosphate export permease